MSPNIFLPWKDDAAGGISESLSFILFLFHFYSQIPQFPRIRAGHVKVDFFTRT